MREQKNREAWQRDDREHALQEAAAPDEHLDPSDVPAGDDDRDEQSAPEDGVPEPPADDDPRQVEQREDDSSGESLLLPTAPRALPLGLAPAPDGAAHADEEGQRLHAVERAIEHMLSATAILVEPAPALPAKLQERLKAVAAQLAAAARHWL